MSSWTPSERSSWAIAAETDDWATGIASAASVTLDASQAATKYSIWRSVKRIDDVGGEYPRPGRSAPAGGRRVPGHPEGGRGPGVERAGDVVPAQRRVDAPQPRELGDRVVVVVDAQIDDRP